jgi:DNA-binding NarL/FixJ family response regulator
MPVMNGFDAANILREIVPSVPVFLLTAHYMESTIQTAQQIGIRAVFSKHHDLAPLVMHARAVFGTTIKV